MTRYRISGVPVTKEGKLVKILTNPRPALRNPLRPADLRSHDQGEPRHRSRRHHAQARPKPFCTSIASKKLLVVDDHYNLKGLITVKDIQKKLKYPLAAKDSQGRLSRQRRHQRHQRFPRAGTRVFFAKKVDVLAIDTAHGHTSRVMAAIKTIEV